MSRNRGYRGSTYHSRSDSRGHGAYEAETMFRLWAMGGRATAPVGRQGAVKGKADGGFPINAYCALKCVEEVLDLAGATSAFSETDMLPANALILEIVTHCVSEFTTPTTYNLGDESSNTRFATGLANDTVAEGPAFASTHWASASIAIRQTTDSRLKVTANAAGQGKVHAAVFYLQFAGGQGKNG